MALGIFVIANDFTALSVAVVPIENDLDTSLNRAQWVINAYTVVFGVMIVTGGRLADLYGRRRVFMIGAQQIPCEPKYAVEESLDQWRETCGTVGPFWLLTRLQPHPTKAYTLDEQTGKCTEQPANFPAGATVYKAARDLGAFVEGAAQ